MTEIATSAPEYVVGIPRGVLVSSGWLPQVGFTPMSGRDPILSSLRFIRRERESKVRADAEYDETFQQLAVFMVIKNRDGKFLLVEDAHTEERLQGTWSLGLGEHCDSKDFSLRDTFDRAIREELEIRSNQERISYDTNSAKGLREKISMFIHTKFVGVIRDERDAVGRSHIGAIWIVKPKGNIELIPQVEEKAYRYLSIQEIDARVSLNGWSDIILREILKPTGVSMDV